MTTQRNRKKNLIVSYKNLSDDLKELFKEMYPDGYNDYLTKFTKPSGDVIYVVPLETDDTSYMIKFDVKIDTLAGDLDKALFDDDGDDSKEDEPEFAPLSEAIEKEEGVSHRERVLRHGDFETNMAEDEERRKKLKLDIDKEEIQAAFADDMDEKDSYINDDDDMDDDDLDDDFEPSDDDLRGIEDEFLDAENPPLDAVIPPSESVATTTPKKATSRKKTKK